MISSPLSKSFNLTTLFGFLDFKNNEFWSRRNGANDGRVKGAYHIHDGF
jgi:hypothetical protein